MDGVVICYDVPDRLARHVFVTGILGGAMDKQVLIAHGADYFMWMEREGPGEKMDERVSDEICSRDAEVHYESCACPVCVSCLVWNCGYMRATFYTPFVLSSSSLASRELVMNIFSVYPMHASTTFCGK